MSFGINLGALAKDEFEKMKSKVEHDPKVHAEVLAVEAKVNAVLAGFAEIESKINPGEIEAFLAKNFPAVTAAELKALHDGLAELPLILSALQTLVKDVEAVL